MNYLAPSILSAEFSSSLNNSLIFSDDNSLPCLSELRFNLGVFICSGICELSLSFSSKYSGKKGGGSADR